MKWNIVLVFLVCLTLPAKSQDFQTFYSNRTVLYEPPDVLYSSNIRAVRIDSLFAGQDSVFFPFSNIRQISYDCYNPYGPSWIGEKIVIKNNRQNIFFNKENDSIIIRTDAMPGQPWEVYHFPDSSKVMAQVYSFDTSSFLGVTDSVKVISFQAYDKNLDSIDHAINTKKLSLSKHFGLVKTFNFYLFPNLKSEDYIFSIEELLVFDIVGLTKPEIGIQNLTMKQIYDFQPGDELHIRYHYSPPLGGGTVKDRKTKLKYLERDDNGHLKYVVERIEGKSFYYEGNWSYSFTHDTIESQIFGDKIFDNYLPGEPIFEGSLVYRFQMIGGTFLKKILSSTYEDLYFQIDDSCYSLPICDGCRSDWDYIKGLGGPYYSDYYLFSSEENILVYYKKAGVEWGTPLEIAADMEETLQASHISIFPNPATDFLTVVLKNNPDKANIEIYSLDGKCVYHTTFENQLIIELEGFQKGVYLYKIFDNKAIYNDGKILIQ